MIQFDGIYRGKVEDVNDPDDQGRVRIRVYPWFKDFTVATLPWAKPAFPLSSGAGTVYGSFAVPVVGSEVFVFFEQTDPYQPVYFAEAPNGLGIPGDKGEIGFVTPSGLGVSVNRLTSQITVSTPGNSFVLSISPTGDLTITSATTITLTATNITLNGIVEVNP